MPLLSAPPSGVTVRMYRHGFGDCFLLAFPDGAGGTGHLLVDCGLFWGYRPVDGSGPAQSDRLRAVALDVEEATGGSLDALVVTHEHFDHLAGFHWQKPFAVLSRLTIRELWVAWTEDPDDPFAQQLREEIDLGLTALRSLASHPRFAAGAGNVRALLGFSPSTAEALRKAVELVPPARHRYLAPGELVTPFGSGGARFYVLGPPRHRPLLRSNFRSEEVYLRQRGGELALLGAAAREAGLAAGDSHSPFGSDEGMPEEVACRHPFFTACYGFGDEHRQAWRRIDPQWLESLEALALQYDDFVNNTSLVLAIELPQTRRVLLFPGDAQVGNWLSWAAPEAAAGDGDGPPPVAFEVDGRTVTGRDLLERTAFYKVGHHGSHNATLSANGLERMRDGLVAFVPTDETWAWVEQGSGWKMPYLPIYRALVDKARGRVVQADCGLPDEKPRLGADLRDDGAVPYSESEWAELQESITELQTEIDAFRAELVEDELYFQWTMADG